MENKKIKLETKNTQTFLNNQKNKKSTNKRKHNELLINNKNIKELEDKHFKFKSLRSSFGNIINMKQSKLFNTELENKNNFWSMRNNYSINGGKNKKFNNKKYFTSPPQNIHKKKILNRVMEMCHDLYESKNMDNNIRMKLREDIVHKINHYVNDNLNKNILCPESKDIKKKKIKINFPNILYSYKYIFLIIIILLRRRYQNNKIKNEKKLKSIDSNKMTLKSFIQKYKELPNLNPIHIKKARIVTFENYANTNTLYNHPQIYTLNNIKKYYPLKTQKNLQTFVGFSQLIPERKVDQKEINKQIYSVYKTMKNRNEIAFHI